ncbi:MAG: response regulator [Oscillatoria princeps RMCB-10]|jgi:signal transduction histidine kinase|nr:response regulator [Oscillatoria princeps RMCB-10]
MSKILLIEDDGATRLLLKRDLQLEGYEVTVAKDGLQGLQSASKIEPALIVCDWVMPEMDGVEVCRQLKADPKLATAFFILLTSKGTVADRVAGLDAGADDFLSKPVDPLELQARVRAGLRVYKYQQELSRSNQQLSQALDELRQTQAQLIHSEKMSSLGGMVAGIAHEINNPVNFISGNLIYIQEYVSDLLNFADLSLKESPSLSPHLLAAAEDINLDFLMQDFPKLLNSMRVGTERIRQIVLSLRNFSRLDEAERKQVNLHEGIDSTLLLLQHRLTAGDGEGDIEVIKEYGHLPPVECLAGQMNQVFLNILSNAIDALKASPNLPKWISIRTEMGRGEDSRSHLPSAQCPVPNAQSSVVIRIADNGIGMTPAVQSRIFDPFFTTKPVGSGKGLGLSVSYQIVVEQHGGQLLCCSEQGLGAEFAIEIPLRQSR